MRGKADELSARLAGITIMHAPHIIDLEAMNALRRGEMTGTLTGTMIASFRARLARLRLVRYAHHSLERRIWNMRHNLSPYDAAYVALAETLGLPLITCDAAQASVPGSSLVVYLH